ncbi:nucleoside recognition domain-containing protein [Methanopyrus sp.]
MRRLSWVSEMIRTLLCMYVGVLVASYLGSFKACARSLLRVLKPVVGSGPYGRAASLSALSSSVALYAARDSVNSTREAVGLLLLLAFPTSMAAAFQFYLPVVVPAVGPAGLFMIGVSAVSALLTSALGRVLLPDRGNGWKPGEITFVRDPWRTAHRVFFRVGPAVVLAMVAVKLGEGYGVMEWIKRILHPLTRSVGLPPDASLVVFGCLINVAVGAALGADLWTSGKLRAEDLAIALAFGRALSLPRIHLQFLLPPAVTFLGRRGLLGAAVRTLVETSANVLVVLALAALAH